MCVCACVHTTGAVVGLSALGPTAVRLLLLPQLPAYLDRLQPLLDDTADTDMSRPGQYTPQFA